jgi:hypothetical protein
MPLLADAWGGIRRLWEIDVANWASRQSSAHGLATKPNCSEPCQTVNWRNILAAPCFRFRTSGSNWAFHRLLIRGIGLGRRANCGCLERWPTPNWHYELTGPAMRFGISEIKSGCAGNTLMDSLTNSAVPRHAAAQGRRGVGANPTLPTSSSLSPLLTPISHRHYL